MRYIVYRLGAVRSFEHYTGSVPADAYQLTDPYYGNPIPVDYAIPWEIEDDDADPYNYLRTDDQIALSPVQGTQLEPPDHRYVFNQLNTVPGSPEQIFSWVPLWNQIYNLPIMPVLWVASERNVPWLTRPWRAIIERWCWEAGYPVNQGPQLHDAREGTVDLVDGVATITNQNLATDSLILLTPQNSSGVTGDVRVTSKNTGSCDIASSSVSDTSTIGYLIL